MTDPAQLHAEARQNLRFAPGSPEERAAFAALQARLPRLFEDVFPDPWYSVTSVWLPLPSMGAPW